jgi:predicted phage terminase large subunit-like protein
VVAAAEQRYVVVREPTWWPQDQHARERVADAMGPLRLRWCPWTPTVKQEAALRVMANEVAYGGAAGGGKSVYMLMAAAQFVDVPLYRALILRRTYGELAQPDGLIDLAHRWWDGTGAKWNQSTKTWTFPSTATITFGHMATATAHTRYQGGGYHFVGYEEATHFLEVQYLYLHSRTRRVADDPRLRRLRGRLPTSPDGVSVASVPIRMRSTANPGGVGHEWYKLRFVDRQTRYVDPDTGERAVFIRARLADNDYLDQLAYVRSLAHLDPVTRRQLLDGDWEVVPGGTLIEAGVFDYFDRAMPAVRSARAWDLAATKVVRGVSDDPDWTVGTRMHRTRQGDFEVVDVEAFRDVASVVEQTVKRTARMDGRHVVIGIPKDPGQAGKAQADHYARNVLRGYVVKQMSTSKDKETRATPVAAAAGNGLVRVARAAWTAQAVREWTGFPFTGHADFIDSLADAHTLCSGSGPVRVSRARGKLKEA